MNSRPASIPVVLDTNVVLDWLVFGDAAACRLGEAIDRGALQWLSTPRMHDEWRSVVSRPLATRWEAARQRALTVDLSARCRCIEVASPTVPQLICSDPDDQVFIDLALAHPPSLLLTRDRALLALRGRASARGVTVTTPASWAALHAGP